MAKKKTLNEIGEMLSHVVKSVSGIEQKMATKDDIANLRRELKNDIGNVQTQVNSIEQQLRETRTESASAILKKKSSAQPVGSAQPGRLNSATNTEPTATAQ